MAEPLTAEENEEASWVEGLAEQTDSLHEPQVLRRPWVLLGINIILELKT